MRPVLNYLVRKLFVLENRWNNNIARDFEDQIISELSFESINTSIDTLIDDILALEIIQIHIVEYINTYSDSYGTRQLAQRYDRRCSSLINKLSEWKKKLNQRYLDDFLEERMALLSSTEESDSS